MDMTIRPRRLRGSETLRKMVRETRVDPASLIYPMFVTDGENTVEEISAMPGQYRYTVDRMGEELERLHNAGVKSVMLFGIPEHKDEVGSQAWAEDGVVQRALRRARELDPELFLITDVCMCEYTSHGHCGVLCGHDVDNDATLELLAKTALSHVEAGAQMVAPSDMMDGRVRAIRECLDEHGHTNIPIMSYAVKFASSFYGPFRDSATARAIRWTSTTGARRSRKLCWTWRRARTSSWSSPPCPIWIWCARSATMSICPWPPTA